MRIYTDGGLSWTDIDINRVDSIKYPSLSSESKISVSVGIDESFAANIADKCISAVDTLVMSGYITTDDLQFLKRNFSHIRSLDISDTNIKELPDSMLALFDGGRRGFRALKELKLPSALASIGNNAFADLISLERLTMPETLSKIGRCAFKNCLSLKSVTISPAVVETGDSIFAGCVSLKEIVMNNATPPAFWEEGVLGIPAKTVNLIVPEGSGLAYLCSQWGEHFIIIDRGTNEQVVPQSTEGNLHAFGLGGYPATQFNPENGFVAVKVPYGTDLSALKVNFSLQPGCELYLGETALVNGVSENDYNRPQRLRLVDAEGNETEFIVSICYSDLPVIYINNEGDAPIESKEEYVNISELYITNSDFNKTYLNSRIKGRGNSSWSLFDKKSFTLKLEKKDNLLGMKKHKTFALVSNHTDKTFVRNAIAYQLGREVYTEMPWTPSTIQAHLVLNGEYHGLYCLTETCKIDANRVNIPNIEDCPDMEQAADYGFMVELNEWYDEYYNFTTSHNFMFSLKDPDGEDISPEMCEYVRDKIQSVENALYAEDFYDPESENYYRNLFDVPSWIDWILVNEVAKNKDSDFYASCNMYYDPADGKIHMGPLWDFDIGFGNYHFLYERFTGSPLKLWTLENAWALQMRKDPQFVEEVKARYFALEDELYRFVDEVIPATCAALEFDANINFERWPILGTYIWPNPKGFADRLTYQSEVDYMLNWLRTRLEFLHTAIEEL